MQTVSQKAAPARAMDALTLDKVREALIRLHAAELERKKLDEVWINALADAARTLRRLAR